MSWGESNPRVVCAIILSTLWALACGHPAAAVITAAGDIDPPYDSSDPWVLSTDLIVGHTADASILVSSGSQVDCGKTFIATGPGVTAGVTVSGTGSVWDGRRTYVGEYGSGTITVENGARLVSGWTTVGTEAGSSGRVLVTGPGSTWETAMTTAGGWDLIIGELGVGEVIVSNGAKVTGDRWVEVWLGYSADSTGSLTVTDPNSVWENAGLLVVGFPGTGSLLVSNGGTLKSTSSVIVASGSGANGSVTVTGSGSTLRTDAMLDVDADGHGELLVSDGGRVESVGGIIDSHAGSSVATVTGPNSVWENAGETVIGQHGTGSLMISDGGTVTSSRYVGIAAEYGARGSAIVTGPGSTLQVGEPLFVGMNGQGELLVSDGGRVESIGGRVGSLVAGQYSVATITGPGSVWLNSDVLNIGHVGRGRLTIEDGGRVTCERADVGWGTSETGIVEVRGAGSILDINWRLLLGAGYVGTMSIEEGGRVTSTEAQLGATLTSTAVAVVDGAGSVWSNSGSMSLWGGAATLRILHGGLVESGDVTASAHGAIEGDGTLRTGMLTMWGTIRPGNSIGTLTVDGDVTMEPNSVLETEIDDSGHGDKLSVTGDVNIAGGMVSVIPVAAITNSQQYTIVEANSVSGTFDTVVLPDAIAHTRLAVLGYEPDSVSLTVTPFDGAAVGRTRNQRALGAALQSIAEVGPTPVTAMLQQVQTLDGVRGAYDQLSGQSRPALAPVALTDSAKFMGIVSNRLQGAHGVAASGLDSLSDSPLLAMALPDSGIGTALVSDAGWNQVPERNLDDQEWGVWAKAYGLYGDRETENGTPGYSYNVFGQSFGVDLQFSERFMGGVTGGLSNGQVDYDHLSDEAGIDATHAGLYGNYSADGWYLSSLVMYSWLNLDTRRVVNLTGERHKGSFDGHEWSAYVEAGFDWQVAASWLVQPLAALQVAYLHLDGYAETGLSSSLVYRAQDYESYKGSLGAKVTKELILDSRGRSAIVQGRGRWVHEFGDTISSVDVRFEDVPSVWWTVEDAGLARDSFLLGAGAGVRLARGLRAFVDYDASLSSDYTVQVISGAIEYRW